MPTSHPHQISTIMAKILELRPCSVLDIGVGFGKYGYLCREYLELWDGREQYHDWKCVIDGIEAFEFYITDIQKAIYNNIYIGDALDILPLKQPLGVDGKYDLVLLIDVLEHFSRDDGELLLKKIEQTARAVLLSIPKQVSKQGAAFGNEYESHISSWSIKDFTKYHHRIALPDSRSYIYIIIF